MKADLLDIPLFKEYLEGKGLETTSINQYCIILNAFLSGNPDIDILDSYNEFIKDHAIKKRSNIALYALKHYIKFKIVNDSDKKKLLSNLILLRQRDPKIVRKYISRKDRLKIISSLDNLKHKIMALIQNETGARAGDILKLKVGSIKQEAIKTAKKEYLCIKLEIIGKRNKLLPKYIINPKIRDIIWNYVLNCKTWENYYFLEDISRKKGNVINLDSIKKAVYNAYWRDIGNAIVKQGHGIKSFTTHDFRRSIARDVYYSSEKDVLVVKEFLGHNAISTTMRYLRFAGLSNVDASVMLYEKIKGDEKNV